MAKNYWVTEYFRAPKCPLGCDERMTGSPGQAKFRCERHGIKVEFTIEMKGYLRTTAGEPPDNWPWNDLRKR